MVKTSLKPLGLILPLILSLAHAPLSCMETGAIIPRDTTSLTAQSDPQEKKELPTTLEKWGQLPPEIQKIVIFANLDPRTIKALACTSKKMRRLIEEVTGKWQRSIKFVTIDGYSNKPSKSSISADGKSMLFSFWSASDDCLRLMSLEDEDYEIERYWEPNTNQMIAYDSDHKKCAIARGSSFKIKDLSGQQLANLEIETGTKFIESIAFNPEATQVVIVSEDKSVSTYDAKTGKRLLYVNDLIDCPEDAFFNSDGTKIIVQSFHGTIVYDTKTGEILNKVLSQASASNDETKTVRWQPSEKSLLIEDSIRHKSFEIQEQAQEDGILGASLSGDGKFLALLKRGEIQIWGVHEISGLYNSILLNTSPWKNSIHFSPDNTKIIVIAINPFRQNGNTTTILLPYNFLPE